jgi:DNA-binding beta-propeller fold protein YncE
MRMRVGCAAAVLALAAAGGAWAQADFVNFESGHTRPLALSPDGTRLFAVNTPDNRLAIYTVGAGGLTLAAEVPVGLEPVAVAARSNTEVWVVNHLSDSVSVVSVNGVTPALSRVTRTLLTCDEPRDVVFAGPSGNRAFITTTRRGQNCPSVANPITAGLGRALVQVFDATNLGTGIGGTPIANIVLFGDTPRALARTPDGSTVYAAVFHSGSRTTSIFEGTVNSGGGLPPMPPGSTPGNPSTGLIVKWNGTAFVDEINRNWNAVIPYRLPDQDVFLIDANATPPALFSTNNSVVGVGTIIFNMAVRPDTGRVYVSNTDARNQVRFEPRISATQGVQGHIAESRITTIAGTVPTARHLNPHLDGTRSCVPPGCISPQSERDQTLAFPTDMVFSADGQRVYVAGLGSGKVGIYDTDDLEGGIVNDTLVPVGQGPSGVALDAANDRLYVMNRISHDISIVSNAATPASAVETGVVPLRFDPSPPEARDGRIFLYDAFDTSGHGDSACATCHIFGDFDSLAWDLGDPFGTSVPNPNPFRVGSGNPFHPLKGPMTTQSLRGMADAGPMHWRGDRTGGTTGGDPLDESLAFTAFNPAFVGLLGRAAELTPGEMQAFTDFILTVRYPPNPIRALSDVPTTAQANGENLFINNPTDAGVITCEFCHALPFGTDGFSTIEGEPQEFKIAHLRNIYQKVGMFRSSGNQVRGFGFLHDGSVVTPFEFISSSVFENMTTAQRREVEQFILAFDTGLAPMVGQQVTATSSANAAVNTRINDMIARADVGDCDLIVKGNRTSETRGARYVGGGSFQFDRNADTAVSLATLLGFTNTAGQEMTFACVPPGSGTRIGVDRDRDAAFDRTELDCGTDPADPSSVPAPGCGGVTTTTTSTSTTSSTAPPVCGNGVREGGEQCDGSDFDGQTCPGGSAGGAFLTCFANCTINFANCSTTTSTSISSSTTSSTSTTLPPGGIVTVGVRSLKMRDGSLFGEPSRRNFSFKVRTTDAAPANRVVAPAPGSAGDPTVHGLQVTIYNGSGSGEKTILALPAGPEWVLLGSAASPKGYRYKGPTGGVVQKVLVKDDLLKVKAKGAGLTYTLNEPSQGSIAVRLAAGGALTWCGVSVPKPGFDTQDSFVGLKNSPAPTSCPAVP